MKFTLSWLKEYLDTKASLEEIVATLTNIGLEVEQVIDSGKDLAPFIVAEILAAQKHPNADKLQVCRVNNGREELQIVCGAANARAGLKVVLAQVGVLVPNGQFEIKKSKIRDVESNGMLCSADELNLGKDSQGIIELPKDAKVGEPAAKWLGANDPVIEVAITPNRGDCLGVYGIARDLAAAGIGTLKKLNIKPVSGKGKSAISVTLETKNCPFFIGRYIKGVKNGASPDWLKKRLESIGLRPISTLVDITNFLTHDLGRPAHVYDADTLKGNLSVRAAKKGEKLKALDDKTYELAEGITVIADNSGAVAIGGIIGVESTGCTENTKNIFLEIAYFAPGDVATTGQKLQINSDARYRFERGVDPAFLEEGAGRATQLITELCGGEASELVIAGAEPKWQREIEFEHDFVESLIGIKPSKKEIEEILDSLGFAIKGKKVSVPSWRADVEGRADIAEEVARIYGFDKIPAIKVPRPENAVSILSPRQRKLSEVRRILAGRGLTETVTFSFVSSKHAKLFGGGVANDNALLNNPISSDLDAMRPSILPSLLYALQKNEARGFSDIAIFEVGPIFSAATPDGQKTAACGIRSGNFADKNVHGGDRKVDAFDAKSDALAALSQYIDPSKLTVTREAPEWYHPGKSGALVLGKQVLGYFGELHPGILQKMDVAAENVAGFEIFPNNAPQPKENQPKEKRSAARAKFEASIYQSVERDFAFLVDEKITAAEILGAVKQVGKDLIESINIFDVYAGKGIEPGKKSVAFSIRLQPKDRTLTDQEIESVSRSVIDTVTKSTGGVLRS